MNVEFEESKKIMIQKAGADGELKKLSLKWLNSSAHYRYSYNFTWMGRPIIQYPQDMIAMQELIWSIKPDFIIETGIAHGGSLVFYASLLELLGGERKVIGVDVEIRPHNRVEIEKHPMFKRITLLEGSSLSPDIVSQVKKLAVGGQKILLVLDSNHTHAHVLKELDLYSPMVKEGGYIVVFDTVVEDMSETFFQDRPWGRGDNPKTAVWEFLKKNDRFVIDKDIENKLLITVAPDGYLRCVKN